ncbi:hypothetical protein SLG_21460 [Sphingobium sp. SYK-6]|uniref:hypothetical protein n=1 Tax=Sphingobium sp. (strain NBRC 103272 / SYK-6) TaxID=627192 RepID=UPI0002276F03|nr:hypothetical protein [Sphingobium sp. SYK-6]BAK66821.1 hypothetical protein SLG_21460 [Sphingobium sp. SYK-6]
MRARGLPLERRRGWRTPALLLLAVLACLLAGQAWRDASLAYWLATSPGLAPSFLQSDPRIGLELSDRYFFEPGALDVAATEKIVRDARAVLRDGALNAAAMRQLGLAANATGDPSFEGKLRLAERISRRDQETQLALMALATSRGDDVAALGHLDILLTVNPGMGREVFPALALPLHQPAFRRLLLRYSARPWFRHFLATAIQQSQDKSAVVALVLESGIPLAGDQRDLLPALLRPLIRSGDYEQARALAVASGRLDRRALESFALTQATTDPDFAPLTFSLHSSEIAQARLIEDGRLGVEVAPGRLVTLVDRITQLPPGAYAMRQSLDVGLLEQSPRVEWVLRCAPGNAPPVWQQAVPPANGASAEPLPLTIPPDCGLQFWRLVVSTPDGQKPVRFEISALSLERTGP